MSLLKLSACLQAVDGRFHQRCASTHMAFAQPIPVRGMTFAWVAGASGCIKTGMHCAFHRLHRGPGEQLDGGLSNSGRRLDQSANCHTATAVVHGRLLGDHHGRMFTACGMAHASMSDWRCEVAPKAMCNGLGCLGVWWCWSEMVLVWRASTTGYGDITPRSYVEQVLASMFMIFGLLFFGLLIGMRPRPLHASGAQTSCQPCCSAECNTLACAHCVLACCPGMHGCEANTLEHAISSLLAAAACAALSASHAPPPALPRPAVPPDMYTVAQAPLPTRQLARPAERKSCTYFARRLAGF
eukprot:362300-Chlamydomonas_euryale.AAC.2